MSNHFGKKLFVAGCLLGAGILTREAVGQAWEVSTGEEAPKNPAAPNVSWPQALAWTAAASLTAGITRTVVRRALAGAPGDLTQSGR